MTTPTESRITALVRIARTFNAVEAVWYPSGLMPVGPVPYMRWWYEAHPEHDDQEKLPASESEANDIGRTALLELSSLDPSTNPEDWKPTYGDLCVHALGLAGVGVLRYDEEEKTLYITTGDEEFSEVFDPFASSCSRFRTHPWSEWHLTPLMVENWAKRYLELRQDDGIAPDRQAFWMTDSDLANYLAKNA